MYLFNAKPELAMGDRSVVTEGAQTAKRSHRKRLCFAQRRRRLPPRQRPPVQATAD